MKQENKKTINAKQLLSTVLAVFMLTAGIVKAHTEILTGIVVNKRRNFFDMELLVRVDEKRPFDHIIILPNVNFSVSIGAGLDMMIESGSVIKFDDEGMAPSNQVRYLDQKRIIAVDDYSVLDMFPGQEGYFSYADRARQRSRLYAMFFCAR
jgi:hypothetical protein